MSTNPIANRSVLMLTVKNHPGVMSHVCGLFARRCYNVEGIMCLPMTNRDRSRIWLLINEDQRLDQIIRQTRKLVDVIDVQRQGATPEIFPRLQELFGG